MLLLSIALIVLSDCQSASNIDMNKNYYEILNVTQDCSQSEITRAYRKLALQQHPDRNNETGAETRFKQIGEAHTVLNQEQTRKIYDHLRSQQRTTGVSQNDELSQFLRFYQANFYRPNYFQHARNQRNVYDTENPYEFTEKGWKGSNNKDDDSFKMVMMFMIVMLLLVVGLRLYDLIYLH